MCSSTRTVFLLYKFNKSLNYRPITVEVETWERLSDKHLAPIKERLSSKRIAMIWYLVLVVLKLVQQSNWTN